MSIGNKPQDFLHESPQLGDLLLKVTSLTKEQLGEALDVQKKDGGMLGEILIKKNFVLPHEILKALCAQLDIPFVEDLKPNDIDALLVMNLPINYAKAKEVLPVALIQEGPEKVMMVAMSNPFNLNAIEDIRVFTGCKVQVIVSTPARIQDAINRVYERANANMITKIEDQFDEEYDLEGPIDILDASENDAPVIKFVNSMIFRAVKEKASDIHVEPFEKEMIIRFRIDGVLYDILHQPKRTHAAVTSRIKVMGSLDIAEKRMPQDGRIKIKLAGKDIDIRLSTVPTAYGERAVMRILEQTGGNVLELPHLGFPPDTLINIEKLLSKKHGILLVTGPTGHGKSTTLSASLAILNNPERCIITVEDPIEYQIQGVNQIQVNSKIDLTFAKALRSILRQNPDIIMIGEIRDKETAEIAVNASLTGHLVLSTLHTNDSAGAPPRLIDMGVEPFLIASSLLGIIAQRLIRKVCTKCRQEYEPSDYEFSQLEITRQKFPGARFYKAVGCPSCSGSGYSGRTVVQELMVVDDDIRQLIVKSSDGSTLKKKSVEKGMRTLREDGINKVTQGITTIEELMRATQADE